jgi:hypothetical protein
MYRLQSAWLLECFVLEKSATAPPPWLSLMPELFSGFGITACIMTEIVLQFKRIDDDTDVRFRSISI